MDQGTGQGTSPLTFVFILVPDYSALSLISALETLRVANRGQERPPFAWQVLSVDGGPVASSLGAEMPVDGPLRDIGRREILLLVSGANVQAQASPTLMAWLRRQHRRGAQIGGLCTAAHLLAEAGLLRRAKATIHWENRHAFQESFPDVELSDQVFLAEGAVFSTAGGTASIDLILDLIAREQGQGLANLVAGRLNYHDIRFLQRSARVSMPGRIGIRHAKLRLVLDLMEAHLEEPVSPAALADHAGISVRQLERLFRRYLGCPPKRFYNQLRLQRAQDLLLQSKLSVTEVSIACGFNSITHFSKLFRERYGVSPTQVRRGVSALPRLSGANGVANSSQNAGN
ncbi:GlxA family transcriptional regulator [Aliiroseovarius sp.]|uniref:GlxA family transcriptional regulator n=1 Tax=Aliiroseovarius sp. TaxID=1872442 RepID=UPI003BAD3953